jgi:hypothetical protein
MTQAELDEMFTRLMAEGNKAGLDYMLTRVPANLQANFQYFYDEATKPEEPPEPAYRLLGSTAGINKELFPLIMVNSQFTPLDLVGGDQVRITGSGWASIDGLWFPTMNVNTDLGQFRLVDADTSGETTGNGIGAVAEARRMSPK